MEWLVCVPYEVMLMVEIMVETYFLARYCSCTVVPDIVEIATCK